jgi:23S rRNA pseudouridine1911/1915/1917 synthase
MAEEWIDTIEEEEPQFEHFRLNIDAGQEPMRVDKYMSTHLEKTSRNRIQSAIKNGYVMVGEKTVKANYIVRPGDVIRFVMPYERRGVEIVPQDIPLDIIYEDSELLIVNKAAGMVVHPGHGNYDGTLVNALAHHLGVTPSAENDERGGFLVHRIDKDTSGLLLISKNDEAQLSLAKQFFERSVDRRYQAIVWGDVKEDTGTIDAPLERDPSDRTRYRIAKEEEGGKRAVTHWTVLERFGFVTLIECVLETGRTHQIRVHMASMGHPIFNDEKYGGSEKKIRIWIFLKKFLKALPSSRALHIVKEDVTGEGFRSNQQALPKI